MKKFNGITSKYIDVEVSSDEQFYTVGGEKLYRIETKGRTGTKRYANGFYLGHSNRMDPDSPIVEVDVYGMGGATGHGWGGRVLGYLTECECEQYGIKV